MFFLILDLSYGWVEPPIQSLISRDSPPQITATMMAIMKSAGMFSYFLIGWMGRFYEPLGPPLFWALTASLSLLALVMLVLTRRGLLRLLEPDGGPD